jgi:predicted DNA-binding transcriptional regulator YafY
LGLSLQAVPRKPKSPDQRADETQSQRIVWPLGLAFWGNRWSLAAWCQWRGDFRHFRLDRMGKVEVLSENFELADGRTMEDFLRRLEAEVHAERVSAKSGLS